MTPAEQTTSMSRRTFLRASAHGLGMTALASLLQQDHAAAGVLSSDHTARAKRVIYLFQSGGPSQCDLFDPKPELEKHRGRELPSTVRNSQRITTMTSKQDALLVLHLHQGDIQDTQ